MRVTFPKRRGGCIAEESARWARGEFDAPPIDFNDAIWNTPPSFAQYCYDRYGKPIAALDGYSFAEAKQAYYETYER